ncbi:MAG: DEAD/DEAH box helicase [Desulfobulbaceae bacterium]|nr:DEAD/DEAH box helicase [Desulfobulbaceae bacterium]
MTTFVELGINDEIRQGLTALGFEAPTPVQEQIIPLLLERPVDIVALAQTGTGKTAAFGIPLVQLSDVSRRETQGLVLCPTRELCVQVSRDLAAIARFVPGLRVCAVYGGAGIEGQIRELQKGAQIIVATPGRLNDLLRRRAVDISAIRVVVLDEADEMLQMGFQEELASILSRTPATKNTLLFSATMAREVETIARNYMREPLQITVGQRNSGAENVRHVFYLAQARDRYPALRRIIDVNPGMYAIIFCRTRSETNDVANKLVQDGYSADALHGELSQSQRDQVMDKFRSRSLQMLVATDVAARGLDVTDLTHVINYNLPDDIANYTHRSGRTGRAGKDGICISIINLREKHLIRAIEGKLRRKFEEGRIPSGHDVCEKQLLSLIDTVKQVEVDHEKINPFLEAITRKLASLDRDELVKRFVSVEFNRFLSYYRDAPDLNVAEKPRGREVVAPGREKRFGSGDPRVRFSSFTINVGKKDGMHASRLIGEINEATGGSGIKIGKIEITDNSSMFEADSRFADDIMRVFQRRKINGKDIAMEVGRAEMAKPVWRNEAKGRKPWEKGSGKPGVWKKEKKRV